MHTLQPKHSRLKPEEVKSLFGKYNISASQLPKIKATDAGVPEGCVTGDILRIERKFGDKVRIYYRVVV
jgi:DNA-directed RNA polymerase subunit H (RpoH/RPB5)